MKASQAIAARKMLNKKLPMETIIGFFSGVFTEQDIRDGVIGLRNRRREYAQSNYTGHQPHQKIVGYHFNKPIPEHLLIDRDRRLNSPRDLTGTFCGDPPVGRSALDRRESWQPAYRRIAISAA